MREPRLPIKWSTISFFPEIQAKSRSPHSGSRRTRIIINSASNDEDDFDRFMSGDEIALQRILNRHSKPQRARAVAFLRNASEADEVVQDVFERMFIARHRFDSKRSLSAWLDRILVNLCTDRLRTTKRKPEFLSLDDPEQFVPAISDPWNLPDEALISAEEEH